MLNSSYINYLSFDHIIVYIFLLSMLIAGLYVGRKVKDIKDYSIANKNFGTSVLLLTMLATTIGGGSSSGLAAKIYQHGIIVLFAFLAVPISIFLVGKFIIPRIINFEENDLSMADIMGRFYGEKAKIFTGIIGFLYCLTMVAIQVMTLGFLFEILLGTSKFTGSIIGGGVIIIYTSFGGIRSVAITDVLEFIVLIVIIPLLANLAINKAGGLNNIISNIPADKFKIFENKHFFKYLIFFVLCIIPTYSLSPMGIQRIIMAKNKKQIKKIYMYYSLITAVFYVMITLLGLATLSMNPNMNYNLALPNAIKTILPIGLRGFAIAGMLAVIMSTGDSALNVGSIFFVHNTVNPILKKFNIKINSLLFIKIASLLIGIGAIYLGYYGKDALNLNLYALALFSPLITIPFVCALLGMKGNAYNFFLPAIFAFITFVIVFFILKNKDIAVLLATFTNIITFFGYHYLKNRKFVFIKRSFEEEMELEDSISWDKIKSFFISAVPTPKNILKYATNTIQRYGSNHVMFGAFFCINYIVPIFMWNYQETNNLTAMTFLRFTGGVLCVGLILEKRWPYKLKKLFPIFWYFTVCFCLPFVSTAMYILMGGTTEWIVNISLTIMLMAWLIDWKTFLILLIIGSINGVLFGYYITNSNGTLIELLRFNEVSSAYILIYTIAFACLIGVVFFRKKDNDIRKKLSTLKIMGGSMAHEIKNIIGVEVSNNMFLKMLFDNIQKTKQNNEIILKTDENTYNKINEIINSLGENTQKGLDTVKRIIINMTNQVNKKEFKVLEIKNCINDAIEKYGMSLKQKKNIKIDIKENFKFLGPDFFFRHVIYNLIKNAFKYAREDCKIKIWTDGHNLFFRDNGAGIAKDDLPYIFDYFFTSTSTSPGIGLPFSKMVMGKIGGDIKCDTKTGKESYTTFILSFPKKNF